MLPIRELLVSDPQIPRDTREAIAERHPSAHERLVALGASDLDAAELLGAVVPAEPAAGALGPLGPGLVAGVG